MFICLAAFFVSVITASISYTTKKIIMNAKENGKKKFIKYAEFNLTFEMLEDAMKEDIASESKINWIRALAYLSAKYGGNFRKYKKRDLLQYVQKIKLEENPESTLKNLKLFDYYKKIYTAVLGNFLGYLSTGKYGLKVFSPIAKNFSFSHYNDFGARRSFGGDRRHLGHDLMCIIGTPVIAVESGSVRQFGWNMYGGWRIGIESVDEENGVVRYWYYAHLRKDKPFQSGLKEGTKVNAGDVIGYVGKTGYSSKENVNNISKSHLHIGLQLIFDESQRNGTNEIWIDLYAITKLLNRNRSEVVKDLETKEFNRLLS